MTRVNALAVLVGAFFVGALFIAATLILASCASKVDASLQKDGGVLLSVSASIPAQVAAKLRKLGSLAPDAPLFDETSVRKSLAERPGTTIYELVSPTPDSIRIVLSVKSLADFVSAPDIKASGLLRMNRGAGWLEFGVHLERGRGKALSLLFPALDPALVDALSPPALEEEPTSADDYRKMLAGVFGERSMPDINASALEISLKAPSQVLSWVGGKLAGSTLSVRLPIVELLVLEKPVDFGLRWRS
jgi:hypothetical protein